MKRLRIAIPEMDQDVKNYVRAVAGAGMEPVVISVESGQMKERFSEEYLDYRDFRQEDFDGLLLPGGGDIDPSRYGQENQGSVMIKKELDKLQLDVLDCFVKNKKPVFGICRGHQLINVYFGGTLIQHLPTSLRHSRKPEEPDKVHRGIAEEGSWLARIYGREFFHNSSHHQAVDRAGEGLVIDSYCPEDGIVEALHHDTLPVYSVQWHPERMCLSHKRTDTVDGLPVLKFFAQAVLQKS